MTQNFEIFIKLSDSWLCFLRHHRNRNRLHFYRFYLRNTQVHSQSCPWRLEIRSFPPISFPIILSFLCSFGLPTYSNRFWRTHSFFAVQILTWWLQGLIFHAKSHFRQEIVSSFRLEWQFVFFIPGVRLFEVIQKVFWLEYFSFELRHMFGCFQGSFMSKWERGFFLWLEHGEFSWVLFHFKVAFFHHYWQFLLQLRQVVHLWFRWD